MDSWFVSVTLVKKIGENSASIFIDGFEGEYEFHDCPDWFLEFGHAQATIKRTNVKSGSWDGEFLSFNPIEDEYKWIYELSEDELLDEFAKLFTTDSEGE